LALLASPAGGAAQTPPFVPNNIVTSTVPANGDLNPYGVAFVPPNFLGGSASTIKPGDILVSNFNNKKNLQGTGTTIITVTPNGVITPGPAPMTGVGTATVFFHGTKAESGLDTGLFVLRGGFVLCAFLPSTDGTFTTHKPGGILVINSSGKVVNTIHASHK